MLGTDPAMPLAERQGAYQRQKQALEAHLAQASLPVLQDHFKRALALLDEAYAEIEISAASGDLPVLRALGSVGAAPVVESRPYAATDNGAGASSAPPTGPLMRHAGESAPAPANGHDATAKAAGGNGTGIEINSTIAITGAVPTTDLVTASVPLETPAALHASGPRSTIGGARIIDEDTFDLAPEQPDLDNIDLDNPNHETDRTLRPQVNGDTGDAQDRPATRRIIATSPASAPRPATARIMAPAPVQPGTERIIAPAPPARPGTNRIMAPAPDESAGNPGTRTVHRALVDALLARADATEDPKLRHALLSEACNAALVAADSPKTPAGGTPVVGEGKPGSSRVPRGAQPASDPSAALARLRTSDPEIHQALTTARDAIARASMPPMPAARDDQSMRAGMPTVDMPAIRDEQSARAGMPTMPMPAIRDAGRDAGRDGTPPRPVLHVPGEPGLAASIADARHAARRAVASTVPMPAISADLMAEDEEQVAVAIAPAAHPEPQAAPTGQATDALRPGTATQAKRPYEPQLAYAGFFSRLVADLLDAGIVMPLMVLLAFCAVHSRQATALVAYALPVLALIYFVYLGWRFDGTPGKLVMGLRLRTPAGRQIGIFAGFLRAVPEVTLACVLCHGLIVSAGAITDADWLQLDVFARWLALYDYLPETFLPMSALLALWILSEPLVLLTNRKRCALQDLLAETVVVQEELDPVAAARLAVATRT